MSTEEIRNGMVKSATLIMLYIIKDKLGVIEYERFIDGCMKDGTLSLGDLEYAQSMEKAQVIPPSIRLLAKKVLYEVMEK